MYYLVTTQNKELSMNNIYSITTKQKNKHLSFESIEYIINKIKEHDILYKNKKRNTGRTQLIKNLSIEIGTSVSNIYTIIKDATITVLDTHLNLHVELSAVAAFNKRTRSNKISNVSKLNKAKEFIDLVIDEVKSNKLSSIDETVNYLKLHDQNRIKGMKTVCTKTIYNYVHQGKIDLKPIDLPRMVSLKTKKNKDKTYIPKRQKGTSIDERPFKMDDRSEFGHWEGDLVTGPRDGKRGAYLTLLERKTRFFLMVPIKSKSSKNVYMKINQLNKFYGESFSEIFKSITFDNGNEFSRYRDMEVKPGTNTKRTTIYFAHPYRSCERGSNENCNGLIRRFIKKGTDINKIPKEMTVKINNQINQKKRKINNYLSSESLFLNELANINVTENTIFYMK